MCVYLFTYRELDEPGPGTVCDFRGCDASVRTHYIKRDVGWRNEVKDFRCAEPDHFLSGGAMTNFAAVHSLRYNPDLLALIFLSLCRNVSELRLQRFLFQQFKQCGSFNLSMRWRCWRGLNPGTASRRSRWKLS